MNMLKFSNNSRCASLAMVSNTIEDFPEPDTPVNMMILRLGSRSDTYIKEIDGNSLVEWIGKVLPTIGVKGAIDRSMRGVSAKNRQTVHVVHVAATDVIGRVDEDLAIKLRCVTYDGFLHACA